MNERRWMVVITIPGEPGHYVDWVHGETQQDVADKLIADSRLQVGETLYVIRPDCATAFAREDVPHAVEIREAVRADA